MKKITFGLIGKSLKHSKSSLIHNSVFRTLKINAEYKNFELEQEEIGKFLANSFKNSIYGLNVTVPYKEIAMPFLSKLDHQTNTSLIRAVNTIKVEAQELIGYNTDGTGFIDALNIIEQKTFGRQFNFRDKSCVILGAGGAAKAIGFSLASSGIKELVFFDKDAPKAQDLASKIRDNFPEIPCKVLKNNEELFGIAKSDMLVNATPIGMKVRDPLIINEDLLHKNLVVFDCVYNPSGRKITLLVEKARNKGARAFDGLWMLICQAIRSEQIWLGQQINQKEVFHIITKTLEKEGFCLC